MLCADSARLHFVLGPRHFGLAAHPRPASARVRSSPISGISSVASSCPCLHPVADVHVDLFDVAGDLRHHVDFLVGLELGGEHEAVGKIVGGRLGHGDGRHFRGFACSPGRTRASNSGAQTGCGDYDQEGGSGWETTVRMIFLITSF